MIPNNAAVSMLLIISVMKIVASTLTSDIQEPSLTGTPSFRVEIQKHTPRVENNMLINFNGIVNSVAIIGRNTEGMNTSNELLIDQRTNGPGFFETLMNRGRYKRMCYFARRIGRDKFLKRICSIVKTLEQYKKLVSYLKYHMVASFYLYGNIKVIREAIIDSKIYDKREYDEYGDLEAALPLALEKNNHDRAIDLLNVRKGITAERDEQCKQKGKRTSFECFLFYLLNDLVFWRNGMALKRFLTLHGDALGDKHPDIFDSLCQILVHHLNCRLPDQRAKKLLIDLTGQSSLLTPVLFAKGFLCASNTKYRSNFIKYGWREAIKEGLKGDHKFGGKKLWNAMKKEYPKQVSGDYPPSDESLTAILKHFPTKRQKEEEWNKKNAKILFDKFKCLWFILDLLPTVLWSIITEYAILWTDIDDSTVSTDGS